MMCLNQVFYGVPCGTYPSSCRTVDTSLSCYGGCNVCMGPSVACSISSNSSVPISFWQFDGNLSCASTTASGTVSFVSGHQGRAVYLSGGSYISAAFYNITEILPWKCGSILCQYRMI